MTGTLQGQGERRKEGREDGKEGRRGRKEGRRGGRMGRRGGGGKEGEEGVKQLQKLKLQARCD